jgi:hypothetical protein
MQEPLQNSNFLTTFITFRSPAKINLILVDDNRSTKIINISWPRSPKINQLLFPTKAQPQKTTSFLYGNAPTTKKYPYIHVPPLPLHPHVLAIVPATTHRRPTSTRHCACVTLSHHVHQPQSGCTLPRPRLPHPWPPTSCGHRPASPNRPWPCPSIST